MATLRMTRAEYEAKYGVKPPGSTSTPSKSATSSMSPQQKTPDSFVSRVRSDIQKRGSNVYNAITGEDKYTGRSPIRRGFEATAEAFGAPVNVGYQALPETARTGLSKAGEVIGKGLSFLTDKISDNEALQSWVQKHPDAARNLEEIAGTGAAAGTISGNILTMNAGAKVIQGGANLGAKGVQKIGQGVKTAGEKTYKSAYDLTAQEAKMVQGNKIKVDFAKRELGRLQKGTPEYATKSQEIAKLQSAKPTVRPDTALEKGIAGTEKQIGRQAGVEKMDLWKNKIEPALKNSKEVVTKDELFSKARARVAAEVDPTRKAGFQRALESLEDDYKNFTQYDLLKAQDLKADLAKFTPSKIFKGQEVASQMKTLQADIASAIREKTYASLGPEARKAFIDYGNLKQLEQVGIKALTQSGKKGGFGGFWSSIKDQATIPVKTVGGKVLYRVGDKLEFLGEKGVKTLGQHFENLGINLVPKNINRQAGFIKNPFASKTTLSPAEGDDAFVFDVDKITGPAKVGSVAKATPGVSAVKTDMANNITMAKRMINDPASFDHGVMSAADKVQIFDHLKTNAIQSLSNKGFSVPEALKALKFTGSEDVNIVGSTITDIINKVLR